jgi:hypothetical protein
MVKKIIELFCISILQIRKKHIALHSLTKSKKDMKEQIIIATINTKSNYKGLNGHQLVVKEFQGTMVECLYFDPEFQKEITIAFTLSEISKIISFDYWELKNKASLTEQEMELLEFFNEEQSTDYNWFDGVYYKKNKYAY